MDDSKPQGFLDDDFDNSGNYLNEKQAHTAISEERSPSSPDSSAGVGFSPISPVGPPKGDSHNGLPAKGIDEVLGTPPPVPPQRKICGLKRRHFWELFGLCLALLVTAAIIAGVVAGLQARNASSHSPVPSANDTNTNPSAPTTALVR